MTLRLMKAFEIEASYQKHKQRLSSINSLNCKRKVTTNTLRNVELINNYKKQKLTADIFLEKQKNEHLVLTNIHIQKSLNRVYTRENKQTQQSFNNLTLRKVNSRASIRSFDSQSSRIKEDNIRMVKKLQKTKSHYHNFRDTSYSKKGKNQTYRQELIKLLENQLGTKPKVVFPNVRSKNIKQIGINKEGVQKSSNKIKRNFSLSKLNKTNK